MAADPKSPIRPTREAWLRTCQVVKEFEREPFGSGGNGPFVPRIAYITRFAKSGDADIAARDGTGKLGSADVTLYKFNTDTEKLDAIAEADGGKVKAYNLAASVVKKNTFLLVSLVDGKWLITWEECS